MLHCNAKSLGHLFKKSFSNVLILGLLCILLCSPGVGGSWKENELPVKISGFCIVKQSRNWIKLGYVTLLTECLKTRIHTKDSFLQEKGKRKREHNSI